MKRTISVAVIFLIALVPVYLWLSDIKNDRKHNLVVVRETEIFEFPPQDYPKENRVIGKLNSSSKVTVLRMGYGKDFRAWKVKTETEVEGWLIEDGKNIEVSQK